MRRGRSRRQLLDVWPAAGPRRSTAPRRLTSCLVTADAVEVDAP
jgi:hypothetical protein